VSVEQDPAAAARAIVDANLYMVLGTADASGRPWVTPVYFAPAAYRDYYWVSSPEARHSRNLEARADVSVVVFDSSVPIGGAQAVYVSGVAREVVGDEREVGIDVFSRRSLSHGANPWTLADVEPPARLRLYRASAEEQYVLGPADRRLPVTPAAS
jgi:nitroimidazol reductase NimA-like FMN-containing flavoprotein (pyridoxamine 5'-phosphate oxidase superfamily)